MKNILYAFSLSTLLLSCGNQNETSVQVQPKVEVSIEVEKTEPKYSENEVAVFTISEIMNQDPSIISVKKDGAIYHVSYTRTSDKQILNYKVKFEKNNQVVWGKKDGRWRNNEYDGKVTFKENGNKLIITQTYSDGSATDKEFNKTDVTSILRP